MYACMFSNSSIKTKKVPAQGDPQQPLSSWLDFLHHEMFRAENKK